MSQSSSPRVAVIGGGPAGLMAAEVLAAGGAHVDLFDAMPSVGRKFLLAGKGGLNLTHGEPLAAFLGRYGASRDAIAPLIGHFPPDALRNWVHGLDITTFIGSSGRVFPTDMKAAPLLRTWLARLRAAGVVFHMRHRWQGWDDAQALRFDTPQGARAHQADALVLALGGASWSRLGSDGAWVPLLEARGVSLAPLQPSNCGFDVGRVDAHGVTQPGWSEYFRSRFAGQPVKTVSLSVPVPVSESAQARTATPFQQAGEFVITEGGVEGSLVYAASAAARERIAAQGHALVHIDLQPGRSAAFVRDEVARPRGARSLSTHLKSRLGIDGVKAALLHELLPREVFGDAAQLATSIKALPLRLVAARPIDEAISSAGGVRFDALDEHLMLRALPGVFCAGEMLDWEAPTGGYLLNACLASGLAAGRGALAHLAARPGS